MSKYSVTYKAEMPGEGACLAPGGLVTPHGSCCGMSAEGAELRPITEETTGQSAYIVVPQGKRIALRYEFDTRLQADYPDAIFTPRPSRFTRFAEDLIAEVGDIAPDATGLIRATAIACATAERFTYGHPEERFNDGHTEIPALGCGLTEGSCVDINTYFIASLRAAGFEAGYVTGFFFPEEKDNTSTDGHCWVATRIDGAVQEWDIAHHLKMGTRQIKLGLNPKPGFRAACFHSMGLAFPKCGVADLKALIEPLALLASGEATYFEAPEIRLHRHATSAVA